MPQCSQCHQIVSLYELTNEEADDGAFATCRECAGAMATAASQHGRTHWRQRSEAVHHDRSEAPRLTALPATTLEELWDFCDPCHAYVSGRGFARFKDGSGAVKWMGDAEAEPKQPGPCRACNRRSATARSFVRYAPSVE